MNIGKKQAVKELLSLIYNYDEKGNELYNNDPRSLRKVRIQRKELR